MLLMDLVGANQVTLTSTTVFNYQSPRWNPTHTKVIYVSNLTGQYQVYLANADGSFPVNLSNNLYNEFEPSISPDGLRVAYVTGRPWALHGNLAIMDINGSNQVTITSSTTLAYQSPEWFADSQQLVYTSNVGGTWQIYRAKSDGSGGTNLSQNSYNEYEPMLNNGGAKIIFVSTRNSGLATMDLSGSNQTAITIAGSIYQSPRWSCDGTKILYTSNVSGTWQIYEANADGSSPVNLSNSGSNEFAPAW